MHTETSIVMRAPLERVFETAADVAHWPAILPHYRGVRFLERAPGRNVVRMAAWRGWIPIAWTAEHTVDRQQREIRFRHLTAFTRGMVVVWRFRQDPEGIEVNIVHDLHFPVPVVGRWVADRIIGRFFIDHVARLTLRYMKGHVEGADEA